MKKSVRIKFVDLPRQNKYLKEELMTTLDSLVTNATFNMGVILEKFESEFAAYCGKKYAVGLNSGTDALALALMAYGIGKGDEVIVPPNSYFSSAMVVTNIGAKPIFVDIDPESYLIDTDKIEQAITAKTKAIIPVHLCGQPADMDKILKIAKKHKLVVIEDCCQAHGAKFKGKTVPFGDTGAFSFFPGKNLGAFGDGGAVVTNNKKIAEKILHLRNDGSYKKYVHKMFGVKSRLDTLQAAILSVKLPYLDKWNEQRQNHARVYNALLKEIPGIQVPQQLKNRYHNFHLFVIEHAKRNQLQAYLRDKGIETIIHYPIPIHLQKPYLEQGYSKNMFPITEQKAKKILSLPMFPELTEEEINFICTTIEKFVLKNKV